MVSMILVTVSNSNSSSFHILPLRLVIPAFEALVNALILNSDDQQQQQGFIPNSAPRVKSDKLSYQDLQEQHTGQVRKAVLSGPTRATYTGQVRHAVLPGPTGATHTGLEVEVVQ